jgi:hypothetical protein
MYEFRNSICWSALLKPYDMKCTSLETLYVGAAVVKPYDI